MEAACDARTLLVAESTAPEYGRLLLKIVAPDSLRMDGALGAGRHAIKERLRLLSRLPVTSRRAAWVGALLASLFCIFAIPPWTLTQRSSGATVSSFPLAPAPGGEPSKGTTLPKRASDVSLPESAEVCAFHLRQIGKALAAYRHDHGQLPAHLSDLYPRYVTNKAVFHCPADPTPGTAGFYGVDGTGSGAFPSSYLYEMTTDRMGRLGYVWLGTEVRGYDATPKASWRETRTAQSLHFGDRTPVLRCYHHLDGTYPKEPPHSTHCALTLAANGSVYSGENNWEYDPESVRTALERMNRDLDDGLKTFNRHWLLYHVSEYFANINGGKESRFSSALQASLRAMALRLRAMERQFPAEYQRNLRTNLRSDLWSAVGSLFLAARETNPALTAYETAMGLPGNHDMTEARLESLYIERGRSNRGIAFFKNRMRDLRYHDRSEGRLLRIYRESGQGPKAVEYLQGRLKKSPSDLDRFLLQREWIEAQKASGTLDQGIRQLEREYAKDPRNPRLRMQLLDAYRLSGERDKLLALRRQDDLERAEKDRQKSQFVPLPVKLIGWDGSSSDRIAPDQFFPEGYPVEKARWRCDIHNGMLINLIPHLFRYRAENESVFQQSFRRMETGARREAVLRAVYLKMGFVLDPSVERAVVPQLNLRHRSFEELLERIAGAANKKIVSTRRSDGTVLQMISIPGVRIVKRAGIYHFLPVP
jgi:hypothetical protein